MRLKYIVFYNSGKRFTAGVKYRIAAENTRHYFIGSRSKFPIGKAKEGCDYYVDYSLMSDEPIKKKGGDCYKPIRTN